MVSPILLIAVLLVSVVLHENAHAIVALWLGDDTAKLQGRITLNPVVHLDIIGSIILPAFLAFTGSTPFGYAKPVPINRFKLRHKEAGFAVVALAGPVSNLLIALACFYGHAIFIPGIPFGSVLGGRPSLVLFVFFEINMLLAAFNLVPIPPLDGSRLIRPFVGRKGVDILDRVEPYGFLIIFGLIYLLGEPFFKVVGLIESGLLKLLPIG